MNSVFVTLTGILLLGGCNQQQHRLGVAIYTPVEMTDVLKTRKELDEMDSAAAEDADARKLFNTAVAAESACKSVQVFELPQKTNAAARRETVPHSLELIHGSDPPERWSYSLHYNGDFGAVVSNEHELAKQVCTIVKGEGGTIAQSH